jgi:CRP/FNR family transcriptional regulator
MIRAQRAELVPSDDFGRLFPMFPRELVDEMARHATRRRVPKGSIVYEQGFPCENVPFLISGVIRVYKIGESGREVTLFRVHAGQSCILSTSCGVSGAAYPAIAEAEEDLDLLTVPAALFREWVVRYPALHQFMCAMLSSRLAETMLIVEEVAFRRVDLRLAEWLLRETEAPRPCELEATHAHIAVELGSAREVISRILKDFERQGFLSLGRGHIEVTSRRRLQDFRNLVAESRAAEGAA